MSKKNFTYQHQLLRHKKTGRGYEVLGIGRMQSEDWAKPMRHDFVSIDMDEVVVYRALADGKLWVRPKEEFFDGRFEPMDKDEEVLLRKVLDALER